MVRHLLMTSLAAVAHTGQHRQVAASYWTPGDVAAAVQVADAHWPGAACTGREQLVWTSPIASSTDGDVVADADSATCTVVVDWRAVLAAGPVRLGCDADHGTCWWERPSRARETQVLCSVLTHEFGHLAGLAHSPDPGSVMYFEVNRETGPCQRAFPAGRDR